VYQILYAAQPLRSPPPGKPANVTQYGFYRLAMHIAPPVAHAPHTGTPRRAGRAFFNNSPGGQMTDSVDSTSDARTVNNVMRHAYRVLSDAEKQQMQAIKDKGLEFYELVQSIGSSRELSLALTNCEQAVMWAVKHLTK
jgi:hypothetical protein